MLLLLRMSKDYSNFIAKISKRKRELFSPLVVARGLMGDALDGVAHQILSIHVHHSPPSIALGHKRLIFGRATFSCLLCDNVDRHELLGMGTYRFAVDLELMNSKTSGPHPSRG